MKTRIQQRESHASNGAAEQGAALQVDQLTKSFGPTVALDDVSLSVRPGEFLTLLGPSGSGKTTLLRLVAGFFGPDAGRIGIGGQDVTDEPPNRRHIGFVFQDYALFPHLSVHDNIAYGLKRRRWARGKIATRVDEVLAMMRLEPFARRRPSELSGGQRQRVAVGRALASHPALLLMDEPLAALDRALRLDLQQELRRLHRDDGTTVVYVTHDQEEALALSDRIAIMRDGRCVQIDSPEDLFIRPKNAFAARFLGDCNLFEPDAAERHGDHIRVQWQGRTFECPSGGLPADVDGYLLGLRPARLRPGAHDDLSISGNVRDIAFLGETGRVTVTLDGIGDALAVVSADELAGMAVGSRVTWEIAAADLFCVGKGS